MEVEEIVKDQSELRFELSHEKLKKLGKTKGGKEVVRILNLMEQSSQALMEFHFNKTHEIKQLLCETYNALKMSSEECFATENVVMMVLFVRIKMFELVPTIISLLKRGETPITFKERIDREILRLHEQSDEGLTLLVKELMFDLVILRITVMLSFYTSVFDINSLHSSFKDAEISINNISATAREYFAEDPEKFLLYTKTMGKCKFRNFLLKALELEIRRGDLLLGPHTLQMQTTNLPFKQLKEKFGGSFLVIHEIPFTKMNEDTVKSFLDNSYGNPAHPISFIYPEVFMDECEYWIPSILSSIVSEDWNNNIVIEQEEAQKRSFVVVKAIRVFFVWCGNYPCNTIQTIALEFTRAMENIFYLNDL
ncbi:hypothetical protein EIN_064660 [Entamoeba invadens IP1]|uniref:Uncharacterized protein n=1 Tax=Entamoeba invadens IP1 TaxID=370355 RepID=A0A0A1TV95_ENTIV|nr:hypothetical protein EIN_064660 [Entamoeba invadens IP1]ELP84231.1 hypothetical protein EIN_064660 [Entamoeba invadens IP1]|eukprot:XP_004183577.1 hypothetical protein EIN_064660 [Entamoeba invadens IP1]